MAPVPEPSVSGGSRADLGGGAGDGRRERTERGRIAVVEALLDLYGEGELHPGVADIADRAGVSVRSVFRYFDDLEALTRSAIEHQWARVGQRFAPPPVEGDTATRVAAIVDHRLALHDAIAPVSRVATRLAPSSATLRRALERRRRYLDGQVAHQFSAELASLPATERSDVLVALRTALDVEVVEHLRGVRRCSKRRTRAALTRTVLGVLVDAGIPIGGRLR